MRGMSRRSSALKQPFDKWRVSLGTYTRCMFESAGNYPSVLVTTQHLRFSIPPFQTVFSPVSKDTKTRHFTRHPTRRLRVRTLLSARCTTGQLLLPL
jgi:hypothetical protein